MPERPDQLCAESEHGLRVGYDVTIQRKEWWAFTDGGTEWEVSITRLSDGEVLQRTFGFHWRARRFARSARRIGKAFEASQRWRDEEIERFTLGWRS